MKCFVKIKYSIIVVGEKSIIVEFKDNNRFSRVKGILIRNDKKLLKIFYGANGDLYFDVFGSCNKDENGLYIATCNIKKTEEIYQYFEQLFNSIINCTIFNMNEFELELCNSDSDLDELASVKKINESLKIEEAYKKLVHNAAIVWYSDSTYDESVNILRIERDDEKIKLTFIGKHEDPLFGFSIKIYNFESKYAPFNICFMNLFNQL